MKKLNKVILLKFLTILVLFTLLLTAVGCGLKKEGGNPQIIMKVRIGNSEVKEMKFELYPKEAPNTVANFITLAKDGYYDGLIFHRIIKGFMAQGGDPTGTGSGGPGYNIKNESNISTLKHERGALSMAHAGGDTVGSQFFICHGAPSHLDGVHPVFGKMLDGFDVLDELCSVETSNSDRPYEDCKIVEIKVKLNGYDVPKVEKLGE